ncbi:MAG: hypothetical protein ACP5OZ_00225 [Candidatus Woesearchaeota archaeon]
MDKKLIKDSLELSKLAERITKNNNLEDISNILLICRESIIRLSRNPGQVENQIMKLLLDMQNHAENLLAEGQHKAKNPDGKRAEYILKDANEIKKLVVSYIEKNFS